MGTEAIKVTDKWQFTIPVRLRKSLNIKPGDYLEPQLETRGLLLRPRKQILIDPDQEWFWSKEWQDKEREVETEIKAKRTNRSSDVRSLMKALRK